MMNLLMMCWTGHKLLTVTADFWFLDCSYHRLTPCHLCKGRRVSYLHRFKEIRNHMIAVWCSETQSTIQNIISCTVCTYMLFNNVNLQQHFIGVILLVTLTERKVWSLLQKFLLTNKVKDVLLNWSVAFIQWNISLKS